MDTHKQLLKTHFDSYAPVWHDRMADHVYAMRYRAVARMIPSGPIESVIDVGCGTGDYAQLFDARRTRYLGIDISENMVAECRRLFPAHHFKVADGDVIDAPQASYDLVLSIGVLEYLTDPAQHLGELARVAKPGGSVIVAVPNGSNRSRQFDRPVRRLLDSTVGLRVRSALGRRPSNQHAASGVVKDPRIRHRPMSVDELRQMGKAVRLDLVDVAHVSLYFFSELIPGAAAINSVLSRALSDRPFAKSLQRSTALVLVARLEKR
jgi:ubiquinone/menaquinone biosynthesis C-methylase UbiE